MVSRKPSSGDTPRSGPHSARIWGRVVESADHHHEREALGTPSVTPPGLDYGQHAWVKVENVSGSAAREGECLEFEESAVTELNNRKLMVKGLDPNGERIGWGITLAPVGDDEVGRLLLTGACKAYVNIKDEGHKYANRVSGSRVLESSASGPVKILHKPTGGTPPEERECVVQLMDEKGEAPKLVKFTTLPAAYGGSRTGITGSAASTNGNTNPSNLKYYPRYVSVYSLNSSGEIVDSGEDIWVANLGQLPLTEGWGLAHKFTDSDPTFGTVYAVETGMMSSHYGAARYQWETSAESSPSEWTFANGEAKLIRAVTGLGLVNPNNRSWAYALGSDVILTHMGRWEVTFGFEGYVNGQPYYAETSSAQSAGTAHTHTYKIGTGCNVMFGVHRNFQPGVSTVGSNFYPPWNINTFVPGRHVSLGANRVVSHEKTIIIPSELAPWHGQHHTRLSLYCNVNFESWSHPGGGSDPTFKIKKCWMTVKPALGTQWDNNVGNEDFTGAGANQYPDDDYSTTASGSGTFVWWGGGDQPPLIDEDGAEV